MNVCWRLLLLFELITGDVIDASGDKLPARKQTLRANKSDHVTLSLDFGVLEPGAYLERKTSPALVLANARDAFCHGSPCYFGQRENLIRCDRRTVPFNWKHLRCFLWAVRNYISMLGPLLSGLRCVYQQTIKTLVWRSARWLCARSACGLRQFKVLHVLIMIMYTYMMGFRLAAAGAAVVYSVYSKRGL